MLSLMRNPFRRRPPVTSQTLAVGAHVRVLRDPEFGPGPWPSEPTGRLVAYSDGSANVVVQTLQGPERTWMVLFDEPQRDTDGDGPYERSDVLERYLDATR